jgi:hypothetical protein
MRKYFVPHLVALLQRLLLQRAMKEVGEFVSAPDAESKLTRVRQSLLEFALRGQFGQVSSRHAGQRFFAVAQEGLGVNAAWAEIRQAISDVDATFVTARSSRLLAQTKEVAEAQKHATEYLVELTQDVKTLASEQKKVADEAAENVLLVAHVQSMVEWIEVFLVSVYAAHLWHMFAGEIASLHDFVPAGVLAFALLGGGFTAMVLRPWRHKPRRREHRVAITTDHQSRNDTLDPPPNKRWQTTGISARRPGPNGL